MNTTQVKRTETLLSILEYMGIGSITCETITRNFLIDNFAKKLWKILRFNYGNKLANEIIKSFVMGEVNVLDDYAINP